MNRIGAGGLFGEVALTAAEERSADVVSLGSTGGVRCDSQGSPLGRRRVDPTDLFKLTREDFDAVVERFPALEDRLMQIGLARIRRACSPQCSPLRAARPQVRPPRVLPAVRRVGRLPREAHGRLCALD